MLMEKGHRRLPVFCEHPTNVIGLILIGPIPAYDGREVITRMTTNSAKMTRSGNTMFLMTKTNLEFQLSELLLMTCIQHKGLKKTYQKGKGSLAGGVQDLWVKLSGIAHEQQANTDLPKSKPKELAKPARKRAAVDVPMAEAACLIWIIQITLHFFLNMECFLSGSVKEDNSIYNEELIDAANEVVDSNEKEDGRNTRLVGRSIIPNMIINLRDCFSQEESYPIVLKEDYYAVAHKSGPRSDNARKKSLLTGCRIKLDLLVKVEDVEYEKSTIIVYLVVSFI
ncbi:hypothetical protein C5167_050834 [Papaver somniferum]|uniref:Uncharacterized protein n=1 Tax=Papaver somniferum TaxID=3469 RepID=A0A4Y7KPS9_PAPSO|nr:hypothetical protein C5167_050834 [Papaver somniferum]